MKIAGLVKSSLIDYPGKVAAVVFTQGCNFRCGFCHNPDLIPLEAEGALMSESDLIDFLNKRSKVLDGVVITGGEPTLQADLVDFVTKIKRLGLKVKLDSNGGNPKIIEDLISNNLIDYIAMDIKGSIDKYENICLFKNTANIKKSINLIINSNISYEFRTTVLPHYHKLEDFYLIGELIKGAEKYTIQGFRPDITFDNNLRNAKPFLKNKLNEIKDIMIKYVKEVNIHDNL